jgi:hypothetical protein
MAVLSPKIDFLSDETPLSWAARQAAFHTRGRLVPFLNDLRIPAVDLARGQTEAVRRLCAKAGVDPEPVLLNNITAIGDRRFRLRTLEFSAEFTTGVETRICPLCLSEDATGHRDADVVIRHRLLWRLSPIRTCAIHGVPLQDIRMHKWDDQFHELQAMRDLINAQLNAAREATSQVPSPLQTYVVDTLNGRRGPSWLDGQGIEQACKAVEMLGGLIAFGAQQKAGDMTTSMWDVASRAGWEIAASGEEALIAILHERLISSAKRDGKVSPRSALGMLYSWLNSSRLSKEPGSIRDLVRDAIIETTPLKPGQGLLGRTVRSPRLSSINAIAQAEQIHPKTLQNVLRVAGLLRNDGEAKSTQEVVVDYERARVLIDRVKYAVPVNRVPDLLACSRPTVGILLELGQLDRINDHGMVESKIGKAIDSRSVQKVVWHLKKNFKQTHELAAGMKPVAKTAEKCRIRLKVILELLFGGHLTKVVRLAGHDGFEAIRIDPAEVRTVLESPPPGLSKDVYLLVI